MSEIGMICGLLIIGYLIWKFIDGLKLPPDKHRGTRRSRW